MVITRKVEFSASHVCRNPQLSDEENRELFGLAANPHGHGHNYVVEVSLQGEPDPVTGMVLDLKELKEILNREIVDPYDHRFLNYEVPPFDQVVPTTENIARDIWRRLEPHLTSAGPASALRAGIRNARPVRGLFWGAAVYPRDPPLRFCGLAPPARAAIERGREPAAVRQMQQSLRARAQLCGGGERARTADERTGRAVDTARLDDLVARQVLTPFDHRNLNAEVGAFHDVVPTSENLAIEICRRLKRNWSTAFPGEWPSWKDPHRGDGAEHL